MQIFIGSPPALRGLQRVDKYTENTQLNASNYTVVLLPQLAFCCVCMGVRNSRLLHYSLGLQLDRQFTYLLPLMIRFLN